jgi:RimJ/RimL family protein N-acetyltransferase
VTGEPVSEPQIQIKELCLRRFVDADASYLFSLDNDPEVMRYINGGAPTPYAVIETEILPSFLAVDKGGPLFGFWAVVVNGGFCGWVSLRHLEADAQTASLGYRFCRAVWGRGYATEAARAIIARAFDGLGLMRVVATTYEKNRASRQVMEKLGMRLVRRFRISAADLEISDTYYASGAEVWDGDDVEYAVDRDQWRRIFTTSVP